MNFYLIHSIDIEAVLLQGRNPIPLHNIGAEWVRYDKYVYSNVDLGNSYVGLKGNLYFNDTQLKICFHIIH